MQPLNKSYLWAFCCLLLSLTATAQENYQDGYVVFSGKDTVKGRIDFREWTINPNQIAFEDARSGKKTQYSPNDLSAFAVSGDVYRTYLVKIFPYARDASQVTDEYATAAPHDSTVFLRLVTGGKLNLYSYFDASNINYFFVQRPGTVPEQLQIRTSATTDNNGQPSMATQDLYKGQLAGMLTDCPAVVRKAAHVGYSENALHRLIFAYNNCGKDTVEGAPADAEHGKAVRLVPMIGGFHTSLHVTGDFYSGINWPGYSSVTGGVGVLGILPRSRQQFSLFADVLYSHFNSLGSTVDKGYGLYQFAQLTYDQAQLDLMFRYRYPTMSHIRPFVNIGFSNSLIFNNKSFQEYYEAGEPTTKQPIYGSSGSLKSSLTAFLGGVGVEVRRFSIEARIYKTDGLSNITGNNFTPTSYVLLVGFSL